MYVNMSHAVKSSCLHQLMDRVATEEAFHILWTFLVTADANSKSSFAFCDLFNCPSHSLKLLMSGGMEVGEM